MRGRDDSASTGSAALRVTFFVNSIIGYVENPAALYTRALANGLAVLGSDVRVVEERQNDAFTRTLRATGSAASRHVYERFPLLQYSTYEPRTGASLLEWLTREVSLIDTAVAVQGVDGELARWIANITRAGLTRAFLIWDPVAITAERMAELELDKYDVILSPAPLAGLAWLPIRPSLAEQDLGENVDRALAGPLHSELADPIDAAGDFLRALGERVG